MAFEGDTVRLPRGVPRHRIVIAVVAALAVGAMGWLWVVTHPGDGPPLAAVPVVPAYSAPPPPPSVSPPVAPAPSVSSRSTVSGRPPARRSPPPSLSPSPSASPDGLLSAQWLIAGVTEDGFQVAVIVTNRSDRARPWRLRVTHRSADGVRVTFAGPGVSTDQSGDSVVFSGDDLPGGRSATFAIQATKRAAGVVRPASCAVEGNACAVTVTN
jgi:hypothetical protein